MGITCVTHGNIRSKGPMHGDESEARMLTWILCSVYKGNANAAFKQNTRIQLDC